jgi:hypothetical protein
VAYLEVTASRGRRLAFRELQPSDFGTAGRYVVLGLAFTSAQALNAVEFRVFTAGTRAVSLDYIDLLVRQEERTAVRRRHATRHK